MSACSQSLFFFFKQKTAYEMRISDWSSDVCSSDLGRRQEREGHREGPPAFHPRRRADERRMAARPHEAAPRRKARELAAAKDRRRLCRRQRDRKSVV